MPRKIRLLAGGLVGLALVTFSPLNLQSTDNDQVRQMPGGQSTITMIQCDCGAVWGDVVGDGTIDPIDVVFMVKYVYKNTDHRVQPPDCPFEAGDINCDEAVNPVDVTFYVSYVYKNNDDALSADPCPPTGHVVGHGSCKTFELATTQDNTPSDQDCIEYEYDGVSVLRLKHVNAGFNCCPDSILADIHIADGTITIDEAELLESGGCGCLCLFDVDYEIVSLPPAEYTISVNGLNLYEGDKLLEFTVDLAAEPSGSFCVFRDHYPWGY